MTTTRFAKRHISEEWVIMRILSWSFCVVVLLISGCVQYPMGLNEQQWNSLTPQQQADYQSRQYAIDEDRRKLIESENVRRREQAIEAARVQQEKVVAAYANARYGDVISVTARGGRLAYKNKKYPCEATSFDLVRGERKEVEFRGYIEQRGVSQVLKTRCIMRLSDDGNTLYFNDGDQNSRRIAISNDGAWRRGATYSLAGRGVSNDLGVDISNMAVTIRLRDVSGVAPQQLIIEHR